MQTAVRAHYNLEELWTEAVRINKISAASTGSRSLAEPPVVKQREAQPKVTSGVKRVRATKAKEDPADEV
jgi:ribosome-associated protein